MHPPPGVSNSLIFPSSLWTKSFAILSPSPKCSSGYGFVTLIETIKDKWFLFADSDSMIYDGKYQFIFLTDAFNEISDSGGEYETALSRKNTDNLV